MSKLDYRIGFSQDIHTLVKDRPLILAGVEIPFEKGLLGHSDADVIYHVVAESIFGALALGDLGTHFPSVERYKDISSALIVAHARSLLDKHLYVVNNIDITVVCEAPKLSPYIETMRENLSKLLRVDKEQISIKATTKEKHDSVGHGDAIEAYAVVLIRRVK